MPALFEYTNVYGTALEILKEKGYQIWYQESDSTYWAEKDGWDFVSRSPCGLLGLIAIFEYRNPQHYREYWWRAEEVDLISDVPKQPQPYRSVLARVPGGRSKS